MRKNYVNSAIYVHKRKSSKSAEFCNVSVSTCTSVRRNTRKPLNLSWLKRRAIIYWIRDRLLSLTTYIAWRTNLVNAVKSDLLEEWVNKASKHQCRLGSRGHNRRNCWPAWLAWTSVSLANFTSLEILYKVLRPTGFDCSLLSRVGT